MCHFLVTVSGDFQGCEDAASVFFFVLASTLHCVVKVAARSGGQNTQLPGSRCERIDLRQEMMNMRF